MTRPSAYIGVDGGGSGTRVVIVSAALETPLTLSGAPSALSLGAVRAWNVIRSLCEAAYAHAGLTLAWEQCALAAGMAGAHHDEWRQSFIDAAPPLHGLQVETDAFITLFGAHAGKPGAIIALGTGSVGEALFADGQRRVVGGYGFPAGDEASGAWFGLRASLHAQYALDGRAPPDTFVHDLVGAMSVTTRGELVQWLSDATPAHYASLAPVVLAHSGHPLVVRLLEEASREIDAMIDALDREGRLRIALCGGFGAALREHLPARIQMRLSRPKLDAVQGALEIAGQLSG
jgi:glucosamine kinase